MSWFRRKKERTPFEEFKNGRCVSRVWLNAGKRGKAKWRVSVGRLRKIDDARRVTNSFDRRDLADLAMCISDAHDFLVATGDKDVKRQRVNGDARLDE